MSNYHVWVPDDTLVRQLIYHYTRLEQDLANEEAERLKHSGR